MRDDWSGLGIGVFFVAAGILFLLDALDAIRLRASYLWPLLLIGLGLAIIAGARTRAHRAKPEAEASPEPDQGAGSGTGSEEGP